MSAIAHPEDAGTAEYLQTYEEWRDELIHEYSKDQRSSWLSIGEWLYNAKDNGVYRNSNVIYHVCEENYKRMFAFELNLNITSVVESISKLEEGCLMCGAKVPDGVKMIALLEKL